MSGPEISSVERFEQLRQLGGDAAIRGDYVESLEFHQEALAWAEQYGEREDVLLATCNVSAIRVALGDGEQVLATLKKVLMASGRLHSRFLAANSLAQYYELTEDVEKMTFYGRVALDNARRSGIDAAIAQSLNQLANGELACSRFDDARGYYIEALEVLGDTNSREGAAILTNLGYCQLILGQHKEAFKTLFRCRRMVRQLPHEVPFICQIHLDFCYAYLEVDRLDRAYRYGLSALEIAEEQGCEKQIKNCLFLLGEVTKVAGESYEAFSYFSRLQREFYPDNGMVSHFLMTTDVRPLVNLRA